MAYGRSCLLPPRCHWGECIRGASEAAGSPRLCQDTVPSGVVQNCTLLGEELSAWPGIPFIRVILLSVCVLSVWWGIDFRKNRCSYACKLQQC